MRCLSTSKKDVGEIGQVLSDLMKKLEQVSPDELKTEKGTSFPVCSEEYPILFKKCYQGIKNRRSNRQNQRKT